MKSITKIICLLLCVVMLFTSYSVGVQAAAVKIAATEKLTAEATADTVKLTWKKVSKATGYKVYQLVDGKYKAIKIVKTNKYVVDDLTASETYKFAVKAYTKADGETLVIVTADHATGGMTLLSGSIAEKRIKVNFSTAGHNGIALPVFAWGPHSEDFVGIYENTELSDRIRKLIK